MGSFSATSMLGAFLLNANRFPRYFAVGVNYLPERGYVRCDDDQLSFLVVPSRGETKIQLPLAICLEKRAQGRMSEMSREDLDWLNATCQAYEWEVVRTCSFPSVE